MKFDFFSCIFSMQKNDCYGDENTILEPLFMIHVGISDRESMERGNVLSWKPTCGHGNQHITIATRKYCPDKGKCQNL